MTSKNILIIDDSEADRFAVKNILKNFDKSITIDEAETGKKGVEKIFQNQYDCIFIDYVLPDIDGISLIKKFYNKEEGLGPCPIILLTGHGDISVMLDAVRYGAQDYLNKDNITPDILNITMHKAKELFDLKRSRNEAQAKLVQSQKMEALGQFTGGIAHDFNNILTIIMGNISLIETKLAKENLEHYDWYEAKIKTIQRATQSSSNLIKRLMVFARQKKMEPKKISVNTFLKDLKTLLPTLVDSSIKIKITKLKKDISIFIDPHQLEHALINLCINARDAMPDGGILTIEAREVDIPENTSFYPEHLPAGKYVTLTISDTGEGIAKDILDKVFDPFFTTKEIGKGTGLGLSMVHGFIEDSNGHIQIKSEEGRGTRFCIYFPCDF